MTNNDLKQIDRLVKKNLKNVATKKDLTSVEKRLWKEFKNDIDDAVAQITTVIMPLEERVEEIEGRLGIVNP